MLQITLSWLHFSSFWWHFAFHHMARMQAGISATQRTWKRVNPTQNWQILSHNKEIVTSPDVVWGLTWIKMDLCKLFLWIKCVITCNVAITDVRILSVVILELSGPSHINLNEYLFYHLLRPVFREHPKLPLNSQWGGSKHFTFQSQQKALK